MNNITKYFCSAVYYDPLLRSQIIDLLENHVNALAESPGLDIEELLKHAYRARSRSMIKHIFLMISFGIGIIFFPLGILIAWISVFIDRINLENSVLRKLFSNNTPNLPPNSFKTQQFISRVKDQICKNVIYYSGYSPFPGYGSKINSWSFVVDTDKADPLKPKVQQFNLNEIYDKIERDVNALGFKNLDIEDRLIVNGRAIRQNSKLLPNTLSLPVTSLSPQEIKPFINLKNKNARYYQMIRVRDWDDEIVFTVFFSVTQTSKFLFFEANYYILTPIKEEYKRIRSISSRLSFRQYFKIFFTSLFVSFLEGLNSLFYVFIKITDWIDMLIHGGRSKTERFINRNIKNNPDYDYGATRSIREIGSSNLYAQYFQVLDRDMYMKTIEKKILNSIQDFLESKGIDTTEFRERETKILNEGIIITGGSINAQNIDIGKKETIIGKTIKTLSRTSND